MQVLQSTGLTGAVAISGGQDFSLALKNDGTVWAWGQNNYGQLGNGYTTSTNTPVQVSGLTGVMFIAAGGEFALALKRDGAVWAWGWNGYDQLGDGTRCRPAYPRASADPDAGHIRRGWYHSMAIKSDGSVWVWGKKNDYGQMGDSSWLTRSPRRPCPACQERHSRPSPPAAIIPWRVAGDRRGGVGLGMEFIWSAG